MRILLLNRKIYVIIIFYENNIFLKLALVNSIKKKLVYTGTLYQVHHKRFQNDKRSNLMDLFMQLQ